MPPWEGLPHGIDSSLKQRIFGPLYDAAAAADRDVDLDKEFSRRDEEGLEGLSSPSKVGTARRTTTTSS
jgi:hypothetical protein